MSREALVLLVCCCDFRDGAERLIPSKSLRNAVIRAFPGLFCILRMCAPRRAAAVVRPRGRKKSADRRRRILISRLLIIRASVPRWKSPFPAYFRGFPAVSPLIPPYPAFLKYPVSPHGFYIIRKLTVTECKRLQTVPDTYAFPVSDTQAYKMLGNGWTVDVIAHIMSHFTGLTEEPVEVLSMYDGMSCGHIALDKLGVDVTAYYATEIDKYAIQTTQHNYPETVQLGDAFQVREEDWTL